MLSIMPHQACYHLNHLDENDDSRLRTSKFNATLTSVKNCYMPLIKLLPGNTLVSRTASQEETRDVVIEMDELSRHSAPALYSSHTTDPPARSASIIVIPGSVLQDENHCITIDLEAADDIDSSLPEGNNNRLVQCLENAGLALVRNLFTVGISTALREYVNRGLLRPLFEDNPLMARTLGGAAIGFPIALQLIAIARDMRAGTQTPASLRARLANISLTGLSGAAVAATGGLTLAASAMIAAVFVYVPLRDFMQYFLQLGDNNSGELHLCATGKTTTLYTFNQTAVDQAMEMLSNALIPVVGSSLIANMLGRAIINIAGETGDELAFREFNAHEESNLQLQFSLGFRRKDDISLQTALDHICNTLASRASLFSSAFANAYAVPFGGILNSMVVGATMGAGYIPFIYTHAQRSPVKH